MLSWQHQHQHPSFFQLPDKALSSPQLCLSHLHRQLSGTNLLFSFSHQGRGKEICNRWCWAQPATAGLNKPQTPPAALLLLFFTRFPPSLSPLLNLFFFFLFVWWRWITESLIHRVVRAFLVPIRGAPVTSGEACFSCEFNRLISHGGGRVLFSLFSFL